MHARSSSPSDPITLAELKHGDRAVIIHVDSNDAAAAARLAARGIVPGIQVGILRAGDPCLIGIDNDRWALNHIEASSIHVDVLTPPRRTLRQLFGRS
ncbi:MAG: FeoA family protein [Gammaproteobacteria bacterium]